MFRTIIDETPFFGEYQNSVLSRISGESYNGDVSFISTLRALVYPRMPETETLSFSYRSTGLTKRDISRNSSSVIMSHVTGSDTGRFAPFQIRVNNVCGNENGSNAAVMDMVEGNFINFTNGRFTRIDKFTEFFKKMFRALCYVDPESKVTVIFVDSLDYRRFHLLQIAIPVMLPWYFPVDKGLSKQELAIIESLREKDSDKYIAALYSAAERYDFRSMKIRAELNGFEKKYLNRALESSRSNIDRYMSAVHEYEQKISDIMQRYYDESIRIEGINVKLAQDDGSSEMMNYFLRNKNLSLVSMGNTTITFNCKGYLTYFDEEIVKKYLDTPNSVLYRRRGSLSGEDVAVLMRALFLDQKLRMRFCARYEFDLFGTVRACGRVFYGNEFNDCTPNPHIDAYECIGNHAAAINDRIRAHDYIGAIEQCLSSCMSLNFADSVVIDEFMCRICGTSSDGVNIRCVELPDGTIVEPKVAVRWLKEQSEEAQDTESGEETNE